MKFNTYDELISYLNGKKLSTLNFEITEDPPATGDSISTPPPTDSKTVGVVFSSLSDKPVMEFTVADQSFLLVEDFEYMPNTCSTTKLKLCDREIMIKVCEDSFGLPVVKFDVLIEEKLYSNKEFYLVTDKTKYKNTINI